jgi:organic radical activating enzyme
MDSMARLGTPGKPSEIMVREIYTTIQGEGHNAGMPVTIVRFQGCNLNPPCDFCDTGEAQDPRGGTRISVSDIAERVEKYGIKNVLITGGEPFAQPSGLLALLYSIRGSMSGVRIMIETNGTVHTGLIDLICSISNYLTVSPKRQKPPLVKYFHLANEVRCPIRCENDLIFYDKLLDGVGYSGPRYISPVMEKDKAMSIRLGVCLNWLEKNSAKNYRLSLQLHKLIGVR